MIYTIEDLRNGKCAVINDGTLEELQAVLKAAFPSDIDNNIFTGNCDYYYASSLYKGRWGANDGVKSCGIPTQSVKEFYKQLPQNTMKQYLTRKQLIELYEADDCNNWRTVIGSYLDELILKHDDFKVEIGQCDIDLANKKCSKIQKELLTKAGLKLTQKVAVCDSKDGDCIKDEFSNYYYNKNNFIIKFHYYSSENIKIDYITHPSNIYPSVQGELITTPLTLQIKIN